MSPKLPPRWQSILETIDLAFQPILNIHTGRTFGVEALLRNHEEAGFDSIFALFDAAYSEGILYAFDLTLTGFF